MSLGDPSASCATSAAVSIIFAEARERLAAQRLTGQPAPYRTRRLRHINLSRLLGVRRPPSA
jgi:hypothetical protein